jgi:hypothetical protein
VQTRGTSVLHAFGTVNAETVSFPFSPPNGSPFFPDPVTPAQGRDGGAASFPIFWYQVAMVLFFAHGIRSAKHKQKCQQNVGEEFTCLK